MRGFPDGEQYCAVPVCWQVAFPGQTGTDEAFLDLGKHLETQYFPPSVFNLLEANMGNLLKQMARFESSKVLSGS